MHEASRVKLGRDAPPDRVMMRKRDYTYAYAYAYAYTYIYIYIYR